MTLSHNYRVHKKGVPHVAFRKTYLSQLRAMLPLPAAQFGQRGSPESGCSTMEESPEAVDVCHRPVKTCFRSQGGQGDTHTNCTPPDRVRLTGRGGGYGVRLPAPSAAGGDG